MLCRSAVYKWLDMSLQQQKDRRTDIPNTASLKTLGLYLSVEAAFRSVGIYYRYLAASMPDRVKVVQGSTPTQRRGKSYCRIRPGSWAGRQSTTEKIIITLQCNMSTFPIAFLAVAIVGSMSILPICSNFARTYGGDI